MGIEDSHLQDIKPDRNAEHLIGLASLTDLSLPDIFEQVPLGVAYCRMIYEKGQPIDFQYLYTNPIFHQVTGLGSVIGQRISEVIPGIQRSDPWLIETYGRVAATGQPEAFENFLIGLNQWFSIQAFCPKPGHFIALFSIVSGRKEYEARLISSEARSRALIDASPVPNAITDRNSNILYLNAAFCRTFGYTLKELRSLEDWWPLAYPDSAYREWVSRTWQDHLDKSLTDGTPFEPIEVQIRCQNREIRTVMASAVPLADFVDENLLLLTLYDITRRVQAERALVKSEEALHLAQSLGRIGSFVMGRDSETFIYTKETARLFELNDRGACRFEEWFSRVHPDDQDAVETAWRAALLGAPYNITFRIVVNGQVTWIRALADLQFGDQGQLVGAIGTLLDISDLKQTEVALRESEERLSLAQSAAHIGIWDWNLETNETWFNNEYYDLLGLPRGAPHTYQDALELVHQDDRADLDTAFQSALAGKPGYDTECRIVRPLDNVVRWIRNRGQVLFDGSGRAVRAMGVTYDITDRALANEKLKEREQLLSSFLNHSATVAFIKDEEGRHLFVSPNFEKRFKLLKEGWKGKKDWELWPATVAEAFRKSDSEVLESDSSIEVIEPAPNPDGTTSWWRSIKFSFSDATGNRYVGGLAIDITDIKEAETHLVESEERFRSLFESAQDGILLADKESRRFIAANAAMCALLGYSQEELLTLGVADIHPSEQLPQVIQEFDRMACGEVPQLNDIRILRKDGTERLVSIVPASMGSRGQRLVAGLFRDVTERHRQEAALRDADRRKDQFLATLAHELRNPLAPIRIGLGILRRARDNPDVTERTLDLLDRQMLLLIRLIDELMDISRITTGKIKLQITAIEIATVIQQAMELSLPFITESGHKLHFNLPNKAIIVNADLVRLGQAFANLLNNAAKFTPRGGQITVNVEQRNEAVVVRVLDNGIGLPTSMLTHIFEPFTQVDQSLEKQYGGLGIGLSLVKELVTLHGGTVEARSEGEGKGSEFIVCLPCATPTSAALDPQIDQATASQALIKRRILIADDNTCVTTALSMLIEAIGHPVAIARDGLEAVKLAEEFKPELILLDLGMPKQNGFDACQVIRKQTWGRDIFIAALTGWGSDSDKEKAKDAGFDRYLVKPVHTEELEILIKTLPEKPVE